jgi:hypothetical protein
MEFAKAKRSEECFGFPLAEVEGKKGEMPLLIKRVN